MILPIKPKPLMVTKRSANLSTYFNEDAKLNESSKSYRKLSEPNVSTIFNFQEKKLRIYYFIITYSLT